VLEAYRAHVAERAEMGIVPEPLNANQVADLIELLKNPPAGEEEKLVFWRRLLMAKRLLH